MSRLYSLTDANAIVPDVIVVTGRLRDLREEVVTLRDAYNMRAEVLGVEEGEDPGEDAELLRLRLRTRGLVDQMQADAAWLDERDIVLRDIPTGLIDFPAQSGGEPVWLCWRLGETAVTAWHRHDAGFAGRRPLSELDPAPTA